jgi:hypothetical protein
LRQNDIYSKLQWNLSGMGVRTAYGSRYLNTRQPVKRVFYDCRVDVVTAADNKLLCAAGQPKITV